MPGTPSRMRRCIHGRINIVFTAQSLSIYRDRVDISYPDDGASRQNVFWSPSQSVKVRAERNYKASDVAGSETGRSVEDHTTHSRKTFWCSTSLWSKAYCDLRIPLPDASQLLIIMMTTGGWNVGADCQLGSDINGMALLLSSTGSASILRQLSLSGTYQEWATRGSNTKVVMSQSMYRYPVPGWIVRVYGYQ
ncbi:hypothetical protein K474DRAFT_1700992, partial [Panus rudis PR-1116 ss-1]